jgi:hypothetical protein
MAMEIGTDRWANTRPQPGGGLASTRWTSTVPTPFGPAPGGGRLGGMFESGFAADPVPALQVEKGSAAPGQTQSALIRQQLTNGVAPPVSIKMDPLDVIGKGPFTVKKEPVAANEIPSMVIRFQLTDRGTLTKEALDKNVHAFLKSAGYRVSVKSTFTPIDVTWRWVHDTQADFYYPVVSSPAALAGMRYSGNAIMLPVYQASDPLLAKLPNQIWIYTMAVTSAHSTMSDGEAAQVLTLLKQSMVNMRPANFYTRVALTLRGCPSTLFGATNTDPIPKPSKAGWSPLILIVAYELLSIHMGSDVI